MIFLQETAVMSNHIHFLLGVYIGLDNVGICSPAGVLFRKNQLSVTIAADL